jgi:dTDP-4-amino-4,6-dideoxygalactose transaminase
MVKFLDIKKITESFQPEIGRVVQRVLDSGFYVRSEEVQRFEPAYTSFTGTGIVLALEMVLTLCGLFFGHG